MLARTAGPTPGPAAAGWGHPYTGACARLWPDPPRVPGVRRPRSDVLAGELVDDWPVPPSAGMRFGYHGLPLCAAGGEPAGLPVQPALGARPESYLQRSCAYGSRAESGALDGPSAVTRFLGTGMHRVVVFDQSSTSSRPWGRGGWPRPCGPASARSRRARSRSAGPGSRSPTRELLGAGVPQRSVDLAAATLRRASRSHGSPPRRPEPASARHVGAELERVDVPRRSTSHRRWSPNGGPSADRPPAGSSRRSMRRNARSTRPSRMA